MIHYWQALEGQRIAPITLDPNPAYLVLFFSGFLRLVTLLRWGGTTDRVFCPAKASQVSPVDDSSVRFMGDEFLVAVYMCVRNLVREQVGCIDGIFLGVARSKLEDEIEQLIDRSMFDNVGRYLVRLQNVSTQSAWPPQFWWNARAIPWRMCECPEGKVEPFYLLSWVGDSGRWSLRLEEEKGR